MSISEEDWESAPLPDTGVWARVLERVRFENTGLADVVAKMGELANKGYNDGIVIIVPDASALKSTDGAKVSCDLKKIPLNRAVEYVANAFRCQVRFRGNVVQFYVPDSPNHSPNPAKDNPKIEKQDSDKDKDKGNKGGE